MNAEQLKQAKVLEEKISITKSRLINLEGQKQMLESRDFTAIDIDVMNASCKYQSRMKLDSITFCEFDKNFKVFLVLQIESTNKLLSELQKQFDEL